LGRVGAALPEEGAMFLEQAIQRAAAGAAVQPDGDLIGRVWVVGGEEPEEELILVGGVAVDGQCAGVRLANVEVDFGNTGAVDLERCALVSSSAGLQRNRKGANSRSVCDVR
jgi:hypothetical protein